MRTITLMGVAGAAALLAACADNPVTAPASPDATGSVAEFHAAGRHPDQLTVLTRNMFVGAPIEIVMAETDPNLIPVRAAEAWAVEMQNDFGSRAKGMADEIALTRPHLVGLQEVSLFRSQFPSDIAVPPGMTPNLTPNATNVEVDFLGTLLAELQARGLDYVPVSTIQNFDVEVPRLDGVDENGAPTGFTDIRLTDFNVILARRDVPITNEASGNYMTQLPVPGLDIKQGWTAVDARVGHTTYRFVNTHLDAEAEPVRNGQAQELMGLLANETKPLVVVGDLNTGPGRPEADGGQATYDFILSNGYTDIWTLHPHPFRSGLTCCDDDLFSQRRDLDQRVDLVLLRNMDVHRPGPDVQALVLLVGNEYWTRRRYGIWPSDHLGVAARLIIPRGAVAD
jgi:hypothetical protein